MFKWLKNISIKQWRRIFPYDIEKEMHELIKTDWNAVHKKFITNSKEELYVTGAFMLMIIFNIPYLFFVHVVPDYINKRF